VRGLFSQFNNYCTTWFYSPGVGDFITPTTTANNGSMSYRTYDRQVNQQIVSVDAGAKHLRGSTWMTTTCRSPDRRSTAISRRRASTARTTWRLVSTCAIRFIRSSRCLNGVQHLQSEYLMRCRPGRRRPTIPRLSGRPGRGLGPGVRTAARASAGSLKAGRSFATRTRRGTVTDQYFDATGSPSLRVSNVLGGPTDPKLLQRRVPGRTAHRLQRDRGLPGLESVLDRIERGHHTTSETIQNNYDTTERIYAA